MDLILLSINLVILLTLLNILAGLGLHMLWVGSLARCELLRLEVWKLEIQNCTKVPGEKRFGFNVLLAVKMANY